MALIISEKDVSSVNKMEKNLPIHTASSRFLMAQKMGMWYDIPTGSLVSSELVKTLIETTKRFKDEKLKLLAKNSISVKTFVCNFKKDHSHRFFERNFQIQRGCVFYKICFKPRLLRKGKFAKISSDYFLLLKESLLKYSYHDGDLVFYNFDPDLDLVQMKFSVKQDFLGSKFSKTILKLKERYHPRANIFFDGRQILKPILKKVSICRTGDKEEKQAILIKNFSNNQIAVLNSSIFEAALKIFNPEKIESSEIGNVLVFPKAKEDEILDHLIKMSYCISYREIEEVSKAKFSNKIDVCFKGYILKGEDSHFYEIIGNVAFTGVFDGHGGSETSSWLSKNFMKFQEIFKPFPKTTSELQERASSLFRKLDDEIIKFSHDGSTAVICIHNLDTKKAFFINLGDSRAVVSQNDGKIYATRDHQASDPLERKLVEKRRGFVIKDRYETDRVNGIYMITRSFGDYVLKKNYSKTKTDIISVEPEVLSSENGEEPFTMESGSYYILASDGVWSDMKSEEAANIVKNGETLQKSLEDIIKVVRKRNSYDDITILCVKVK